MCIISYLFPAYSSSEMFWCYFHFLKDQNKYETAYFAKENLDISLQTLACGPNEASMRDYFLSFYTFILRYKKRQIFHISSNNLTTCHMPPTLLTSPSALAVITKG